MNLAKSLSDILQVLGKTPELTITVMGDYCLDKYLYIDPLRDEASVETGLVAYQVDHKEIYPGVGGTVAANLCALGTRVLCTGMVGRDGEGSEMLEKLRALGADTDSMVVSEEIYTSTYIKPMRKGEDGIYRELNRMDIRNFAPTPAHLEDLLVANLEGCAAVSDGIIITDQFFETDCSAVTSRIRKKIGEIAANFPGKFFYADSRGHINAYRNVIIKCNHLEVVQAILPEYTGEITAEQIEACGKSLYRQTHRPVIVTQGEKGSLVFNGEDPIAVPAFLVEGTIDIVGAGDATNAGTVVGLCLGLPLPAAALLGNAVSSITIQQIGVTGTATLPQVRRRLTETLATLEKCGPKKIEGSSK